MSTRITDPPVGSYTPEPATDRKGQSMTTTAEPTTDRLGVAAERFTDSLVRYLNDKMPSQQPARDRLAGRVGLTPKQLADVLTGHKPLKADVFMELVIAMGDTPSTVAAQAEHAAVPPVSAACPRWCTDHLPLSGGRYVHQVATITDGTGAMVSVQQASDSSTPMVVWEVASEATYLGVVPDEDDRTILRPDEAADFGNALLQAAQIAREGRA